MSEKDKAYYRANRILILEKEKARRAERTDAQKQRAREVKRLRYLAKREEVIERAKAYQKLNPEKARESTKAWEAANPSRKKKEWADKNPVKISSYRHKRRALEKGFPELPDDTIERLTTEQQNLCNACGANFEEKQKHLDHIIPLSKNGAHAFFNLQLLCKSCNCSKGNKMPIDWAFYFSFTRPFAQL